MTAGIATHYIPKEKLDSLKNLIKDLCDKEKEVTPEKISNLIIELGGEKYSPEKFTFKDSEIIKEIFKLDSIFEIYKRLKIKEKEGTEEEKKFCEKTLKKLDNSSALSLYIFTEMCIRAKDLKDVKECYTRDCSSSIPVMMNGDFCEGIRATLVDKDKKFNFRYKTVDDLKNDIESIKKDFLPWI